MVHASQPCKVQDHKSTSSDAEGAGGIELSFGALNRRSIPPPFQVGQYGEGRYTRGVAPGWHPPRRWRDVVTVFSSGEIRRLYIYEIG